MGKYTLTFILLLISGGLIYAQPYGMLDDSFGINGKITADITNGIDEISDMLIQSDHKIIVSGNSEGNLALFRYDENGNIDNSFGNNGLVSINLGGQVQNTSIAIQANGKIVVGGTLCNVQETNCVSFISRFSDAGILDNSFAGGTVYVAKSRLGKILIQPDGKILAIGTDESNSSNKNFQLVRYNSTGFLDQTFGATGIIISDLGSNEQAYAASIQADNKIIVGGNKVIDNVNSFIVARYKTNGQIDSSFGQNGTQNTPFDGGNFCNSLLTQPDGKILAGGIWNSPNNFEDLTLMRYLSNGELDMPFAYNGTLTYDYVNSIDLTSSIALQNDGKMLVAVTFNPADSTNDCSDVGIYRFLPDGNIDLDWGLYGLVWTNFDGCDAVNAMKIQPDGKIVVAGSAATNDPGNSKFALARYISGVNVATKNIDNQFNINISPNPSKDFCVLKYNLLKSSNISIQIINAQGQLIKPILIDEFQVVGAHEINVNFESNMPSGIYFIQVLNGENSTFLKLLKEN